jgi:chemotaxis protein MotB
VIQLTGVRENQVADVRGYADQRLRKPEDPTSASNRRISIVVKYRAPEDPPMPGAPALETKPILKTASTQAPVAKHP